jgi:2-C-methyl-D-erythritol 4-phosphate cytidylyltransferase
LIWGTSSSPDNPSIEDRDVTAQHPLRGDVTVLVPAAGLGTRLGPGEPKALRRLGGVSLLVHAVRRLCEATSVGSVVVAAPPGSAAEVRLLLAEQVATNGVRVDVVAGGATRQHSVAAALAAAPEGFPIVLVHDAARAFAPVDLIERVAAAVRSGHPAVIPVLPVVDTIKQVDESGHVIATLDRSALRAVQTPQGFQRELLEAGHRAAVDAHTDDAGLVEKLGVRVFGVPGAEAAMKITRPGDLVLAEQLLHADDGLV